MRLASQFSVPAQPDRVFPLFLDADVMRSCIPGCEELERVDDETFRGRLQNAVAHVKFNAGFSAKVVEMDPPRRVVALLQGEDRRLASSIKVDARLQVDPAPDGSVVGYEMEMAIWGKLGRLGESIVRRRTAEVEKEFVERFTIACTTGAPVQVGAPPEAAPPVAPAAPPATPGEEAVAPPRPAAEAPAPTPAPAPARGFWRRLLRRLRRLVSRSS